MEYDRSTATTPAAGDLARRLEQRLGQGGIELPLLPHVASQVMSLCSGPDGDAREISELLRSDAALMANVFRFANSVLMGASVEIVSLQLAVNRLGLARIREIALIAACKSRVFEVAGCESLVKEMLEHSLATSLWAQEIARLKRCNVEEAFTAGMLHDVGRPVVLQAVMDVLEDGESLPAPDELVALIDEHHARVGRRLLEAWEFPVRLQEIVQHHHDPDQLSDATMARIVRLADDLAHWTLAAGGEGSLAELRTHPDLAPLNIYSDDLDQLAGLRERVVEFVGAAS